MPPNVSKKKGCHLNKDSPSKATGDSKEHHFCFAYKGERMRITPFEVLNFANVQGTSTSDGTQLVQVTLKRPNGRRASTIPRIIKEYNTLSGTEPIEPIQFVKGCASTVQCFKMTAVDDDTPLNPILLLIKTDNQQGSPRYWSWSNTTGPTDNQTQGKTRKRKDSFAGLEELVRCALNLDPSTLDMQGAYDRVSFLCYHTLKHENYCSNVMNPDPRWHRHTSKYTEQNSGIQEGSKQRIATSSWQNCADISNVSVCTLWHLIPKRNSLQL